VRPVKVEADVVVEALLTRFRVSGYAGASLRDLSEASGLKAASLYHRFVGGKPDMALAALDRAGVSFEEAVMAPLMSNRPVSDRLVASAEGVARFYEAGAFTCILAVMLLSDAPASVREKVSAMLAAWQDALAAALTEAGSPDAQGEAEDRLAAIQGALLLRRGDPSSNAFPRAVTRLGKLP